MRPPKSEARQKLAHSDLVSFVPMNNLGEGTKFFEPRNEKRLSDVEGGYTYFADGDVLLAKITPCFENGKLGIARNLRNGIGFGSSEFFVLRPTSLLNADFLFYFLTRESLRQEGQRLMTGAVGHKRLPKEFLEKLALPLPPLSEQQRIATLLDEAFAGLETMRAHAAKNLQNAQELFDAFRDRLFQQRGEGWTETTLGAIASFKNGLNYSNVSKGERVKIVGVGDFQNRFWAPLDELESVQVDGVLSPAYELAPGDILTVRSNGNKQLIGRCILADAPAPKTTHSGFTIRIRIGDAPVMPAFIVHQLKTERVRALLVASGDGTNISSLNQKALSSVPVAFPPLSDQSAILKELDQLHVEAARLERIAERKLAAIDELRQSILQKAFSGELTAPVEIAA